MTVAAIDAHVAGVQFVAVCNGLDGAVTDIGKLRRAKVPYAPYSSSTPNHQKGGENDAKSVGPSWKQVSDDRLLSSLSVSSIF
jgi:hypothetical protein